MPKPASTKTLSNLTLSELETLIEAIVQKNIKERDSVASEANQKSDRSNFEQTFNAREDDRSGDEIIDIIYQRRTGSFN